MNKDSVIKRLFHKENQGILIFILAVFVMFIVIIFASTRNGVDQTDTDGERTTESTTGFFEYNKEPFLPASSTYANLQLQEDLAFFARNFVDYYKKNPADSILFVVDNLESNDRAKGLYKFTGKLTKYNKDIQISVTERPNNRIMTTINDISTNRSYKDELPSSNKKNNFIASLPINRNGYTIDYLIKSNKFIITVYESSDVDTNEASGFISKSIGVDALGKDDYSIAYPQLMGGGDITD